MWLSSFCVLQEMWVYNLVTQTWQQVTASSPAPSGNG